MVRPWREVVIIYPDGFNIDQWVIYWNQFFIPDLPHVHYVHTFIHVPTREIQRVFHCFSMRICPKMLRPRGKSITGSQYMVSWQVKWAHNKTPPILWHSTVKNGRCLVGCTEYLVGINGYQLRCTTYMYVCMYIYIYNQNLMYFMGEEKTIGR